MNKELLQQTINWLEAGAPERRFDMGKMIDYDDKPNNWCGTTCCIAGYVWQTAHTPDDIPNPGLYVFWDTIEAQAATLLGLDYKTAHQLFYPSNDSRSYPGDWDGITTAQAAQAVRNVMARGNAHWEEILDFEESFE